MGSGICVASSELHFLHLPLPLRETFLRTGDLLKEVCEMVGSGSRGSDMGYIGPNIHHKKKT